MKQEALHTKKMAQPMYAVQLHCQMNLYYLKL